MARCCASTWCWLDWELRAFLAPVLLLFFLYLLYPKIYILFGGVIIQGVGGVFDLAGLKRGPEKGVTPSRVSRLCGVRLGCLGVYLTLPILQKATFWGKVGASNMGRKGM